MISQNQKSIDLDRSNLLANFVVTKLSTISDTVSNVQNDVSIIKQAVVKEKREKTTRLTPRNPLTKEKFFDLLSLPRKKRESYLCYSRFRVAITILQITGLRVNEIKVLTKNDFNNLVQGHVLEIKQTKTKAYCQISLGSQPIKVLKFIQNDINTVFYKHQTLGASYFNCNWITFINKRLKENFIILYGKQDNIKSHSCRINYTTMLLKQLPLHQVCDIIGHKDVRTTQIYNRYLPSITDIKSASDMVI